MAGGRRGTALFFLSSKKSPYDASCCPFRFPKAWERGAYRERARVARVDAGDHRSRAIEGGLLAKAAREERVDAFGFERRGPRSDERLLEEAQLSFRREDLVEQRRRPWHDRAAVSYTHLTLPTNR